MPTTMPRELNSRWKLDSRRQSHKYTSSPICIYMKLLQGREGEGEGRRSDRELPVLIIDVLEGTLVHPPCSHFTWLPKLIMAARRLQRAHVFLHAHTHSPEQRRHRMSSGGRRQNHGHLALGASMELTSAAWHCNRSTCSFSRDTSRPADVMYCTHTWNCPN